MCLGIMLVAWAATCSEAVVDCQSLQSAAGALCNELGANDVTCLHIQSRISSQCMASRGSSEADAVPDALTEITKSLKGAEEEPQYKTNQVAEIDASPPNRHLLGSGELFAQSPRLPKRVFTHL